MLGVKNLGGCGAVKKRERLVFFVVSFLHLSFPFFHVNRRDNLAYILYDI